MMATVMNECMYINQLVTYFISFTGQRNGFASKEASTTTCKVSIFFLECVEFAIITVDITHWYSHHYASKFIVMEIMDLFLF